MYGLGLVEYWIKACVLGANFAVRVLGLLRISQVGIIIYTMSL